MQLDENSMTADQLAFMRSAVAIVSIVGGADEHLRESEVETLDRFLKEAFQLFWGASIDSVDGLGDNVASWIAEGDEALLEVIAEAATLPDKMRRSLNALASHVAWADDEVVEVEADLLPGIAEALNLDPYEDPDVDYLYATSGPVIDIGVYTESLRYDENEHGEHLPPEFAQAREEWVKSGNDPDSAHYKRACDLISRWYQCLFVEAQVHVSLGWTFTLDLSDGSVATDDSTESTTPSAHFQQVEAAFGGQPRLADLRVVSVDFREQPSTRPLAKDEPLQASPDVALVAVFKGRVGRKFADKQQLANWVQDHHDLVGGRFSFELEEGALSGPHVEADEDGDGFGVPSISSEGGEVHVVVSVEPSRSALVDGLTKSVAASRLRSEVTAPAHRQEAAAPDKASDVLRMAQDLMGGFVASMEATETQNAGVRAYRAGDFTEAMRCYLEAAKAGDAGAQHNDAWAQHNIGQMYAFGEGVDINWAEAVKWWSAAADQGNHAAQIKVWKALYHGHGGLPVDLQRALRYAELAAAQGDTDSQYAAERIKNQLNAGSGGAVSEQEHVDQLDPSVAAARSAGDQAGVGSVDFGDLVDLHNRVLEQARAKSGTAVGANGQKIAEILDAIDPKLAVAPSQPGVASPEGVGKPAKWDGNPDTLSLNDGSTFLEGVDAAAPRSLDVESMFAVGMAAGYLLAEPLPGDSPGERMVRSLMIPIEDRRFIDVLRGEKDVWPDTEAVVFSALARLLGRIVQSKTGGSPIADSEADDPIESVKSTANLIVSVVMARIIVAERAGESWAPRTKYGEIRPHLDASLPVDSAQTWAEGLDALVAHHAGRRDFANLSRWWLELERARALFPDSLGIAREQARSLGHLLQALQEESGIADGSSGLTDDYSRLLKVQAARLLSAIQSLVAWGNRDLNVAARVGVSLEGLSKLAAGLQKEGHADALGLLPEIWRLALSLSQPQGRSQLAAKMTFSIGALVRQVFVGRDQMEWVSGVREWMETYALSSKDAADAQELARVNTGVRTLELAAEQSPAAGPGGAERSREGSSGDAQPSGAAPRRLSAVPTEAELKTASTEALKAAERVGDGKINAETAKAKMSAWVDMARVAFEVLPDVHRGDLALALRMRGLLALSLDGDVMAKSDFTDCIALGRAVYDKLSQGGRIAVDARVIYSYMTSLWGLAKIELAAGRAKEALILCEEYDLRRQGIPEAGNNLSADDDNKLRVHGHALLSLGKSQEEARSILMRASLSGLMDQLRGLAKLDPV
jgi:uncharacterized tellurite resistance protein B-like protein/tetratricopeptide (TPR) repeat protein